jgi:acetyltransferase-like isoleucine patch superfamily enzyme
MSAVARERHDSATRKGTRIRYVGRPGLVARSVWLSLRHGGPRRRALPIVATWAARIDRMSGSELDVRGRLVLGHEDFIPGYFGERGAGGPSIWLAGAGSRLVTGDGVLLASGVQVNVAPGAEVRIGDRTHVNPNSRILAAEAISIGADCAISWSVEVMDFDAHAMQREGESVPGAAPIAIGDRVWVGARATILKGVEIGDGAVIGAGAVVTRSVPPRALAVGSPARVVREGVQWR